MSERGGGKVSVSAGILVREGRFLICQRRRGDNFPLKWEFPGGKRNLGESARDALVRELREELGVRVCIQDLRHLEAVEHHYPGGPMVQIDFFRVMSFHGEPDNLNFESMVWAQPGELCRFDFLEADRMLVERMAAGKVFSAD